MKYNGFFLRFFGGTMKKVIIRHYNNSYANEVMKKAKKIYRNIIENADDIGGLRNPYGYNFFFAMAYVSVYMASDKKIPPEVISEMMQESLKKVSFVFKTVNYNNPKSAKNSLKEVDRYINWYNDEREKKYPTSFEITRDNPPYEDACWYKITRCPICITCDKLGVKEIMPPLCELDHLMISFRHGKLDRKHMISRDGDYCDYLITGDKE